MNKSIRSIFRDMPVLYTQRLVLRKMLKGDYKDMYEYASDDNVTKYLSWLSHPDSNYTLKYLTFIQSKYRAGEYYDWAIVFNNKMIGTCGFTLIDEANKKAEIGYVIAPEYTGKGLATEAALRIIEFGFCELGLNRIEAHFMEENLASKRVMEKCSMKFEGILRDCMIIKGIPRSIGICSILRKEWEQI